MINEDVQIITYNKKIYYYIIQESKTQDVKKALEINYLKLQNLPKIEIMLLDFTKKIKCMTPEDICNYFSEVKYDLLKYCKIYQEMVKIFKNNK